MKTIVILFAISFVAVLGHREWTDEEKKQFIEYNKFCINESGIDESTLAKRREADENNEKLNCYSTCLLKKYGTLNADGELNVEVARANLAKYEVSEEKIEEMINACKDVTGTGCEKGRNVFKCFMQFKEHQDMHHD
ncbi:PREDICTED: general odorant-binding protein 56h-like [Cyphomyrmex costatus]|uniref:general odorant-binding protein 56h-like n=1 Tax=Cyphomyrmex costatus TaxID=456900 RepID=UPI0008523084|nr:PREDICTED: general odorant-binding protein 56h-like [Cyphomyrmex costatus]